MRLDNIIKCYLTIQALKRDGGVTAKELMEMLKCSSKTAYRYIDAASDVLPVVEYGKQPKRFELKPSGGDHGGRIIKFALVSHNTMRVFKFDSKKELSEAIIASRRKNEEFTAYKFYEDLKRWEPFGTRV